MQPNARAFHALATFRLTMHELCADRRVRFHLPSNAIALEPRLTYGELYGVMRRSLGEIPEFQLVTDISHLYTSNSKMIAPCFSLPAGPIEYGGTCPAAGAYFDLPEVKFYDERGEVHRKTLDPELTQTTRAFLGAQNAEKWERSWVCNRCYAMSGGFVAPSTILKYMLIHAWVQDELARGTFASTMISAIRYNRDYWLRWCGKHFGGEDASFEDLNPKQLRDIARSDTPHVNYFRVHDTGDFYSPEYFEAWCEIAEGLKGMIFWASTRAWASPLMAGAMASAHVPRNLILRPSGLGLDDPPPKLGRPFAAGSMIPSRKSSKAGVQLPDRVYRCPATHSTVRTCQHSDPDYPEHDKRLGQIGWPTGCRYCWDAPSRPVVYKEH